jgi:histidyl-tRNA synthetase
MKASVVACEQCGHQNRVPDVDPNHVNIVVVTTDDWDSRVEGGKLAMDLRRGGVACVHNPSLSMRAQMRGAANIDPDTVFILGPDELAAGEVTVRCLGGDRRRIEKRFSRADAMTQPVYSGRSLCASVCADMEPRYPCLKRDSRTPA